MSPESQFQGSSLVVQKSLLHVLGNVWLSSHGLEGENGVRKTVVIAISKSNSASDLKT